MKKNSKKKIICGVAATALAVTAAFSGCSLVSTDSYKDMDQVIISVNVSKAKDFDANLNYYRTAVDSSTEIKKRDLISYFVNVGYSYMQNYGQSYKQVFEMLVDALADNAIMTQYATMYLLDEMATEKGGTDAAKSEVLATYNAFSTQEEKYEYLLGGKESDDVKIAEYSLLHSINSAIDSYETRNIKDESSSAGSGTRSTPGKVDEENEDYYPEKDGKLDYGIYTGYTGYALSQSGTYENDRSQLLKDKSTPARRITAYNDFLEGIAGFNLIGDDENLRDVRNLEYVKEEYISQLEQRIINKYYDSYEKVQESKLNDDEKYDYIKFKYNELLDLQKKTYEEEDAFASALGNLSDESFLLYSPSATSGGKYGYVYNILLPFNEAQKAQLSQLQADYKDEDKSTGDTTYYLPEYYTYRNDMLKNIKTTDQRSAWFNGETEYAFKADGIEHYGDGEWLFFENNMTNSSRYEKLDKYDGRYAYNGTVIEKTENRDDYILVPEELSIDDMVHEFCEYVNYVLNGTGASVTEPTPNANYYKVYTENTLYKNVKDKEIDYSNFIYTSGKVNFGSDAAKTTEQYNRTHLLEKKDSVQYKALSAVNELQYAYTTDTGVLSQYVGYSVEAGDTSYIKEFEYAAHEAVNGGAGSFNVCAGDYGWHLIYVTYTFDANDMEQFEPDWANNTKVEGTFENLFYEWIKGTHLTDISTKRRAEVIVTYKSDDTVNKYVSRYQDLLDMDND